MKEFEFLEKVQELLDRSVGYSDDNDDWDQGYDEGLLAAQKIFREVFGVAETFSD